jgi:Trk-type K+ transport system membrane component
MLIVKSLLMIILYILMVIATLVALLHDPYFSKDIVEIMYDVLSCVGNNGSAAGIVGSGMPDYFKIMMYCCNVDWQTGVHPSSHSRMGSVPQI